MQTDERGNVKGVIEEQPPGNLPSLKPDDYQYFDKLLVDVDETTLSADEQRERKIMKLLLKIKNGTPPMRKVKFVILLFGNNLPSIENLNSKPQKYIKSIY